MSTYAFPIPQIPRGRGIFCNRTLNFRSLRAIGYDMDYTLVGYHVEAFERRVYEMTVESLLHQGWPVEGLAFDPGMVARGLIIDTELGNVLKANRFGFVKHAMHGTRTLDYTTQREVYARTIVELSDPRWVFLNTLFSLSEGCLYAQLVDLLDAGRLQSGIGYRDLSRKVRTAVDAQHVEGRLKAEIEAHPERFVDLDPDAALTLQDQRASGKKLLLITNSGWEFTARMMSYAYDRYLPQGTTWRDLFDLIIVSARKPDFFTTRSPFFEVATDDGLLRPLLGPLQPGHAYLGGCAAQVEQDLGISGDAILYVGDHMFGDVHVSKSALRWRTALILRELEEEVAALESFSSAERILAERMEEKERLESRMAQAKLALQRLRGAYGPPPPEDPQELEEEIQTLRNRLSELDSSIAPMAKASTELANARWGLLTRAGNDKSHLARQVERYADVYTSRVSNFLHATPFVYLRSLRGSLPHDPGTPAGPPLANLTGE